MSTTAAKPIAPAKTGGLSFMGFARLDGRVGVRNHLAVISTVALSNRIAELAAQRHEADKGEPVLQIKGEFQRGLQLADAQLQDQVIAQLVDHPNIGAALVLCHDRRAALAWQKLFHDKPVKSEDTRAAQSTLPFFSADLRAGVRRLRCFQCSLLKPRCGSICGRGHCSRRPRHRFGNR